MTQTTLADSFFGTESLNETNALQISSVHPLQIQTVALKATQLLDSAVSSELFITHSQISGVLSWGIFNAQHVINIDRYIFSANQNAVCRSGDAAWLLAWNVELSVFWRFFAACLDNSKGVSDDDQNDRWLDQELFLIIIIIITFEIKSITQKYSYPEILMPRSNYTLA